MSLNLYQRSNGIFHIRGTVQGRSVDQSARTRVRAEAEAIRAKLEADLFKRAVYGDKAVATFAEAVVDYVRAGGSSDHLKPLLLEIGNVKLGEINQRLVDELAERMKPGTKASTRVRQVYTPISAVMNFAAAERLCDPIRLRKPKVEAGRVDFLTPAEADKLLGFLPAHLKPLVTFYLATGCRATEALDLRWRDVSGKGSRVVFWDTKEDYPRGVDLQKRAVDLLPARPVEDGHGEGFVFLNSDGEPWHGYDAINLTLRRYCDKNGFRHVHCHLFRHTWATWAYACTRDLTYLMQQGGWRSPTMVTRYAHAASHDLAFDVLDAGWEFFGREIVVRQKKLAKTRRKAG